MPLIFLVTAFVSLRLSFPKLDVTALIATSAVTSLVLGLALQPILGNFFAGLVISIEKPFRLNDWIKVGEQEGRVVAITWRTTHLRTRDNDNLVIPNGKMAEERVLNYYYPHPVHREKVRVGAHYDEPPYRVHRVLLDCAAGVRGVLDSPAPAGVRLVAASFLEEWVSTLPRLHGGSDEEALHDYRVAMRKLRSWLRLAGDELDELGGDWQAVSGDPEAREAIRRFYAVLDSLRGESRSLLVVRFLEGKELAEVARLHGMSQSTVQRKLHKAVARVTALVRQDPALSAYVSARMFGGES
jgi:small-conductance mechanosensitive channel